MTKQQTKNTEKNQQGSFQTKKTKRVSKKQKSQNQSQQFQQSFSSISNSQNQNNYQIPHCILLLGQTGCGKSTVTNYLYSKELLKYQKKPAGLYSVYKNQQNGPQISDQYKSCTTQSKLFENHEEGLIIMDTPGFNSTKGQAAQLQETVSNINPINKLIKKQKPLKIIYVLSEISSGRGGIIVDSLNQICQIFVDSLDQLKQCFMIAITKVDLITYNLDQNHFIRELENLLLSNGDLTKQSKQLLKTLKPEKVIIFPKPDQLDANRLRKIKKKLKDSPFSIFSSLAKKRYSTKTQNYAREKLDRLSDQIQASSNTLFKLMKTRFQPVTQYYNGLINGQIEQTFSRHTNQAIYENDINSLQYGADNLKYYYQIQISNLVKKHKIEGQQVIKLFAQIQQIKQCFKTPAMKYLNKIEYFVKSIGSDNPSKQLNQQLFNLELLTRQYTRYLLKYCIDLPSLKDHQPMQDLLLNAQLMQKTFINTSDTLCNQLLLKKNKILGYYRDNIKRRQEQIKRQKQLQRTRKHNIWKQNMLHQMRKSLIKCGSKYQVMNFYRMVLTNWGYSYWDIAQIQSQFYRK